MNTIENNAPRIELYNLDTNHCAGIFPDLDAARIYAMARPAWRWFIELWDKADIYGNRQLIASERIGGAAL